MCDNCKYETIIESNLTEHIKYKHETYRSNSTKQYKKSFDRFAKNGKLCIFWNLGFCRHEDLCRFVHEEIPACFYQENCRKEKCPFYHYDNAQNNFLGRNLKKSTKNHQNPRL